LHHSSDRGALDIDVVVPNEWPTAGLQKRGRAVGQFRDTRAASERRPVVRIAAAIGALVIAAGVSTLFFFSVDGTQYAIVTDFGKPTQVVTSPGLGFKYPYQSVHTIDRRLFVYASPASEFLTLEKTPVVAAGTVLWRVVDPKRYFETVFDRVGAESRLGDILFAELGAALGRNPLTAFVSTDASAYRAEAIIAEMARRCRDIALADYGIEVVDLQLRSFDFPKQNRLRLYAGMKSERGRLSVLYRSEGEEEGLKVPAVAEEEKALIVGSATEVAQQRRGEGDGEAARIYAEALGRSTDFYTFPRTMEASRSVVNKSTTMVLPADSPFFGVLFDSNFSGVASGVDADDHAETSKKEKLNGGPSMR
jgi:modulator of FtsH protease HflC